MTAVPRSSTLTPSPLTWPIFPALLAIMATLTWTLIHTDLPRPVASGAGLVFTVIAVLVLERLFPYQRAWNRRP